MTREPRNLTAGLVSLAIIIGMVVIVGGLTWWWLDTLVSELERRDLTYGVVNEDSPGESLPPCETEDSDGCYWDADTMGNGRGDDVVSIDLGADGAIAVSPDELPTPTITDGVNDR